MAPRPKPATVDDLAQLRVEIDGRFESEFRSVQAQLGQKCENLERLIADLTQRLAQQEDGLPACNKRLSDLSTRLAQTEQELTAIPSISQGQHQLSERLTEVKDGMEANRKQVAENLDSIRNMSTESVRVAAETLREEFKAGLYEVTSQHMEMCQRQVADQEVLRQTIQRDEFAEHKIAIETRSKEVFLLQEQTNRDLGDTMSKLRARCDKEFEQSRQKQEDAIQAVKRNFQEDMQEHKAGLHKVGEGLASAQVQLVRSDSERGTQINELQTSIGANKDEVARLLKQQEKTVEDLAEARSSAEEQLAALQVQISGRALALEAGLSRLEDLCAKVGGLPIRKVEWRITDVPKLLASARRDQRASTASGASALPLRWVSPPFEAAGVNNLRLEFQINGLELEPSGEEQCSVYLWGSNGLQLDFRLSLGEQSTLLRHTFSSSEPRCGAEYPFFSEDQVSRQDAVLVVGVDIQEATTSSEDEVSENGALEVDRYELGQISPVGSLVMHQYLNHRLLEVVESRGRTLLELVNKKVDVLRSRTVRRVQWRLEQASRLRQCFSEGKPLCSTTFQAAGVAGMQFIFYPSGCLGAKSGFCSFFVFCPPGCTLRCWLWAGRWRREARQESASEKQDLLGRVNFCRFENCVDSVDDSIEVAVEIEEARQDDKGEQKDASLPRSILQRSDGQQAAPQTPQGQGQSTLPALGPSDAKDSPPEPNTADRLESTRTATDYKEWQHQHQRVDTASIKVQPVPKGSSSAHVQQLPAIWTSQGFQSFAEIRPSGSQAEEKHQSGAEDAQVLSPSPPSTARPATYSGIGSSAARKAKVTPRSTAYVKAYANRCQ